MNTTAITWKRDETGRHYVPGTDALVFKARSGWRVFVGGEQRGCDQATLKAAKARAEETLNA